MKARPILFSAPMARALLAGTKTQTRRVVKPQPSGHHWAALPSRADYSGGYRNLHSDIWQFEHRIALNPLPDCDQWVRCPYGSPGDLLWVRETCRAHEMTDAEVEAMEPPLGKRDRLYGLDGVVFAADNKFAPIQDSPEAADAWVDLYHYRGTRGATVPPIHMPRWASRLTLRITDVRVQRLKDISYEDAIAEGALDAARAREEIVEPGHDESWGQTARRLRWPQRDYENLWEQINGAGSWGINPWVWCVSFEVIKANVDRVLKPIEVQACRPADRAMLKTPAGQALIQAAAKALREGAIE